MGKWKPLLIIVLEGVGLAYYGGVLVGALWAGLWITMAWWNALIRLGWAE